MLRGGGLEVRSHNEIFHETTAKDSVSDDEWIRHTGAKGWIALTRDNDIRRTPRSVAAIMESGARVFILRGALPFGDLARQFLAALPKVYRFLERHPLPFLAGVRRETFPRGRDRFVTEVAMYLTLEMWRAGVDRTKDS